MRIIQTTEDLKMAVQSIIVKDFGDFKRKTITYLNRYTEELESISEDQQKHLQFMKWYIQFHPNLQINETKLWTLQQIEKLNSH